MAIDPRTGEILALVTHPSYEPNDIEDNFPELIEESDAPLLNRATQSLYPPGSTFKLITSAAALKAGVEPSDEFFDPGFLDTPGYRVFNYQGKDFGRITFAEALVFSVNVIFAKIAIRRWAPISCTKRPKTSATATPTTTSYCRSPGATSATRRTSGSRGTRPRSPSARTGSPQRLRDGPRDRRRGQRRRDDGARLVREVRSPTESSWTGRPRASDGRRWTRGPPTPSTR